MISLTYISTATAQFAAVDLKEFLRTTREQNHAGGLTGVLLYAGGHFIQTVEGPVATVDAALHRIERDVRHRNMEIVLREEIAARMFPDWSMGFEELTPEEAADLPGFNHYLAGKPLTPSERTALGNAAIFHRVFRRTMLASA